MLPPAMMKGALRESGALELRDQYFEMFHEPFPPFNFERFLGVGEYVAELKRCIETKTVYVQKRPPKTWWERFDEYLETHPEEAEYIKKRRPARYIGPTPEETEKLREVGAGRLFHQLCEELNISYVPFNHMQFDTAEEYILCLKRSIADKKAYVQRNPGKGFEILPQEIAGEEET